ncbi:MAG: IS21 family transposase [Chloroflexota bacterium]
MANRSVSTVDIVEILRLVRAGESDRTIAQMLGYNRRSVIKYRHWATEQGLLDGPVLAAGALQQVLARSLPPVLPPQQRSSLEPYREEIATLLAQRVEVSAIRARLEERHGHPVSYSAVRRLAAHLVPPVPPAFVRVEVAPGSEAQVDFGYAGLTLDPATGQPRKSWVFVLVLSWSRHLYAEVVFDQRVETWLLCHAHAFTAWGGVPARIVPDNLKAAIIQASFTEPVAQRAYRECATHYGFLIDPQPPRTPRLKGKVEQGGVHYVCRNFLAGRATDESLSARNQALARWTQETAGQRVHGTTKQAPLTRFAGVEQPLLRPLPRVPYDPAVWKQVRVYRDCYVQFERAYYSVPFRLVGQAVWVRGGARTVEISDQQHQVVATHQRAAQPGDRLTALDHLPQEKVPGLVITREDCRLRAGVIGPATAQVVENLLAHRPEDRLRSAGRLLRLAARTSPARLEGACVRALAYDSADYVTIRRILDEGLDTQAPVLLSLPTSRPYTFVRGAAEFVASLVGGGR